MSRMKRLPGESPASRQTLNTSMSRKKVYVHVIPAQVDAAKLITELNAERGIETSATIHKIADAKRAPTKDLDAPREDLPLVVWLRKQAATGLDEMFGISPEKAYVHAVIEQHARCYAEEQPTCGMTWWDQGCYPLFELAILYANDPPGARSDLKQRRATFDPQWLPSFLRSRLIPIG